MLLSIIALRSEFASFEDTPGLNENVDAQVWERVKTAPYVAERLADGRYEEIKEEAPPEEIQKEALPENPHRKKGKSARFKPRGGDSEKTDSPPENESDPE